MPEMTKGDPERDATTDAAPEPAEELCPDCGKPVHGKHALEPGSRSWFWAKRVENMMLFAAPAIPLALGIAQLVKPTVTVTLTDKQQAAVDRVYSVPGVGETSVDRVQVHLTDPSVADRLVTAGPALLFGLLIAFMAYALWRIEINLSANGKYTPKDAKVLSLAARWLWRGWWFLMGAEIAVTIWFRNADGGDAAWWQHTVGTTFDQASLVTLVLTGFMGVVARIYRNGAKAYAELEKGV